VKTMLKNAGLEEKDADDEFEMDGKRAGQGGR
jgi:hypothetical protein